MVSAYREMLELIGVDEQSIRTEDLWAINI